MENCHCFLEITSKIFNYEGVERYNDNISLRISFAQKMISLITIIVGIGYISYCIKHQKFLNFIEKSIFHYLDFTIEGLDQTKKKFKRPMKVKKSKNTKSLSLIIMHEKDEKNSSDFKKTTTSHMHLPLDNNMVKIGKIRHSSPPMSREINLNDSLHVESRQMSSPFFISDLSLTKKPFKINDSFEKHVLNQFSPLIEERNRNNVDLSPGVKKNLLMSPGILIDRKESKASMQMISLESARLKDKKLSFNNEYEDENNDFYEAKYLCNCYECCCECCPNSFLTKIILPIKKKLFENPYLKAQEFLMKHCKILCYFCISIAPFFDYPIQNVSSILISGCLYEKTQNYFDILYITYSIFEVSTSSLFFFACIFITSFISTKRELLEIQSSDKISRGYLVYYHVKKAFIFSVFHFILQLVLKGIFLFTPSFFSSIMGNDSILFCLVKNTFYFCFIISKYPNFRNINLIQHDDHVLKSQFKYFNIQNLLIKYLPKAENLYQSLKTIELEKNEKKDLFEVFDGNEFYEGNTSLEKNEEESFEKNPNKRKNSNFDKKFSNLRNSRKNSNFDDSRKNSNFEKYNNITKKNSDNLRKKSNLDKQDNSRRNSEININFKERKINFENNLVYQKNQKNLKNENSEKNEITQQKEKFAKTATFDQCPVTLMEDILDEQFKQARESLKAELQIIDNQKFQVILRNRGVSPLIPIILMWYVMIDSFLSIFIAIVFLMRLNLGNLMPERMFKICSVMEIILNVLEFIFLPWLIRITLETRTFVEYEDG